MTEKDSSPATPETAPKPPEDPSAVRKEAFEGAKKAIYAVDADFFEQEKAGLDEIDSLLRGTYRASPPSYYPGDRPLTNRAITADLRNLPSYSSPDHQSTNDMAEAVQRDPEQVLRLLVRYRGKVAHSLPRILAKALLKNPEVLSHYRTILSDAMLDKALGDLYAWSENTEEYLIALSRLDVTLAEKSLLQFLGYNKEPGKAFSILLAPWSSKNGRALLWLLDSGIDLHFTDQEWGLLTLRSVLQCGQPVPGRRTAQVEGVFRAIKDKTLECPEWLWRSENNRAPWTVESVEQEGVLREECDARLARRLSSMAGGTRVVQELRGTGLTRLPYFVTWAEQMVDYGGTMGPKGVISNMLQRLTSLKGRAGSREMGLFALAVCAEDLSISEALTYVRDWDEQGKIPLGDRAWRAVLTGIAAHCPKHEVLKEFNECWVKNGDTTIRFWDSIAEMLGIQLGAQAANHIANHLYEGAGSIAKRPSGKRTPSQVLRGLAIQARYDPATAKARLGTLLEDADFAEALRNERRRYAKAVVEARKTHTAVPPGLLPDTAVIIADIHYAPLRYPKVGGKEWKAAWDRMIFQPGIGSPVVVPVGESVPEAEDARMWLANVCTALWGQRDADLATVTEALQGGPSALGQSGTVLRGLRTALRALLPPRTGLTRRRAPETPDPDRDRKRAALETLVRAVETVDRLRKGQYSVRDARDALLDDHVVTADPTAMRIQQHVYRRIRQCEEKAGVVLNPMPLPPAVDLQRAAVEAPIKRVEERIAANVRENRRLFMAFAGIVALIGGGVTAALTLTPKHVPQKRAWPPSEPPEPDAPSSPGVDKMKEDPGVICRLSRPLTGDDRYLVVGHFDGFAADGSYRQPSRETLAALAALAPGPDTSSAQTVSMTFPKISGGKSIAIPQRADIRAAGFRDGRRYRLVRRHDGTLKMDQSGLAAEFGIKFGLPASPAEPPDGKASLAAYRELPDALKSLAAPSTDLGTFPEPLRRVVLQARGMPPVLGTEVIRKTVQGYLVYDDTCKELYENVGDGPAYLRRICEVKRGVCGQYAALCQELLRHAGIPCVLQSAFKADKTTVTENDIHLVVQAILPGARGGFTRAYVESTGFPPQGSATARTVHVAEFRRDYEIKKTQEADAQWEPDESPKIVDEDEANKTPDWVVPVAIGAAVAAGAGAWYALRGKKKDEIPEKEPEEKKEEKKPAPASAPPPSKEAKPEDPDRPYNDWLGDIATAAFIIAQQGRQYDTDVYDVMRGLLRDPAALRRNAEPLDNCLLYMDVRELMLDYFWQEEASLNAADVDRAKQRIHAGAIHAETGRQRYGVFHLMRPASFREAPLYQELPPPPPDEQLEREWQA